MSPTVLLDVVIVALLVPTIVYAVMDKVRESGEGARVVGGISPGPTLLSALLAEDAGGPEVRDDERSEAERQLLRAIRASR